MRKFIAAALLAGTAFAAPASAAVTYYTTQASFLAALGATTATVEDFNDAVLVPGLGVTSTVGTIGGGVFNDQVTVATQSTTFSFGMPVFAVGGFFDLSINGAGIGIALTPVPGSTLASEVPATYTGGFFGFISTTSFQFLTLTGGTQANGVETYVLDNLTYAGAPTPAVPEPATWGMMIVGLGVAGLAMRRRATKVSFA